MPLTPSFTVSQNNVTPSTFTLTDTSTGSDGAIANRLIYLYKADNSLFTGAPIQFPIGPTIISPAILDKDYAFNIVVNWVAADGTVLYTFSLLIAFTGFLKLFSYGLTQQIAANNSILSQKFFMTNWWKLKTLISSAEQAIALVGSIFNAQEMLTLAQNMVTNHNLYW